MSNFSSLLLRSRRWFLHLRRRRRRISLKLHTSIGHARLHRRLVIECGQLTTLPRQPLHLLRVLLHRLLDALVHHRPREHTVLGSVRRRLPADDQLGDLTTRETFHLQGDVLARANPVKVVQLQSRRAADQSINENQSIIPASPITTSSSIGDILLEVDE